MSLIQSWEERQGEDVRTGGFALCAVKSDSLHFLPCVEPGVHLDLLLMVQPTLHLLPDSIHQW